MSPRLFWHVLSTEARQQMSYRVDFWINSIVGFGTQFGVVWFLWRAMFAESGAEQIRGYTFDGMIFYYFVVILVAKAIRGQEFASAMSTDIYEGGLNRYLVFPANYAIYKFAQKLGGLLPMLIHVALFGLLSPLVIDIPDTMMPTIASTAMAFVTTAVAITLHFAITIPIQAIAFWADNVWSLVVALRFVANFLGGLLVPLALFPDKAQSALAFLPFKYLFAVPVRTFTGQIGPAEWALNLAIALAWTVSIAVIARIVWRRGELRYSGVGI